eukprot:TRINITY_DN8562_c0_g2_i4.p1 TRINITY_DN8562_c0_g2~~TRINITY_DN8562_c0_g2_i4.p1  ORF type:complete len:382 (+),score=41.45 TRINITY_DN8562_c0_g2_i4:1398-2543(+)
MQASSHINSFHVSHLVNNKTQYCPRNNRLVHANAAPAQLNEIPQWARNEFEKEVQQATSCSPAKLCLLIALEDEAALNEEYDDVARFLNMDEEDEQQLLRYVGTKATWNLSRLDAIAEEVKANMCQQSTQTARMPLSTVQAVNEVLYDRHGYGRTDRIRDPNRTLLHCVLEEGLGTPATLAVLYTEVCRRLGLPLCAQVVDEGYYVLLKPNSGCLEMNKTHLLIDPYDKGYLHNEEEICQIFKDQIITENDPLGAKSLVSSVLLELRDAYWAISLGCAEHPTLVPDICLDLVLSNKALPEQYDFFRERALAASERRAILFPNDALIQQELAIMNYLCGEFETAWMYLGEVLENCDDKTIERQRQRALLEKFRLIVDNNKEE